MNWNVVLSTFGLIFLAELGDKTQLAAIAMTGKTRAPGSVFVGASLALIAVTLLAILAGAWIERHVNPKWLQRGAAALFVIMGVLLFRSTL